MNTRSIALTVGAAAGGMLAAAFLSTAAASAQPDPFGLTPTGDADLVSAAGLPPLFQFAFGSQTFDFDGSGVAQFLVDNLAPDGITASDISSVVFPNVTLDVANSSFFGGALINQEIVLPRDFDFSTPGGDFTLQQGSVFDVANFGAGFGDVYVDLVGANEDGTNQIFDELITPFGNFNISPFVQLFDAAAVNPSDLADLDPSDGLDFGSTAGDVAGAGAGTDFLSGLF